MLTRNTYNKETPKDLYGKVTDKEIIAFIESYGVRPLFLCVTGSHMWNLATPESDVDIRGIFIKPTEQILSLHKGADTIEATNVLGKEVDLQLYEVEKAFFLMQSGNGNIIEMLLAPTIFYQTDEIDWESLAKSYLTKDLADYYKGYYHSQRKRAATNRGGKALTYTYRELYQGMWLMRHGELVHDFNKLKELIDSEFGGSMLLDKWLNRKNWDTPVAEEDLRHFEEDWNDLQYDFEREVKRSRLPDKFDGYQILNDELINLRRKEFLIKK